jgi:alkanesulfonate monooxygenase SsuD/methylene tetrahydromethanopterin reductase-like flavin-dependent oxidoreductase (luciferase family)
MNPTPVGAALGKCAYTRNVSAYYNAALPRFSYVTDPSSDRITMFSEHPEQCIQRIGEYVDIGVDRFMLSFPESASDISGLRLFGGESITQL